MLDKRLKWAFFLLALVFAGLPIGGIILDVLRPSQIEVEESTGKTVVDPSIIAATQKEDMVRIPPGLFLRGYNEGGFDEKPEGQIMLNVYWIDRFEVTYGNYLAFVTATGHRKPISRYVKHFEKLSAPMQPAVYVSWDDADEYCRYRGARLPTEAEWEKAARGSNGFLWPWGNEDKQGWANTGNADPVEFTAPVGSFSQDRSPFGIYDMDGNAMEWVADWYQEDSYKDTRSNPMGAETGFYRVIRGASWGTIGHETRLTIRLKMIPDFRDTTIGFRCAKSATKEAFQEPAKTS
ncbi:MAG: SUMF1/EgtB/PvdO family nonheme iron enzyme [Nitrospirota bacterium]